MGLFSFVFMSLLAGPALAADSLTLKFEPQIRRCDTEKRICEPRSAGAKLITLEPAGCNESGDNRICYAEHREEYEAFGLRYLMQVTLFSYEDTAKKTTRWSISAGTAKDDRTHRGNIDLTMPELKLAQTISVGGQCEQSADEGEKIFYCGALRIGPAE